MDLDPYHMLAIVLDANCVIPPIILRMGGQQGWVYIDAASQSPSVLAGDPLPIFSADSLQATTV